MNYITWAIVYMLGVMLLVGYIVSRRSVLMPRLVRLKGADRLDWGPFVKVWRQQFGQVSHGIKIHPELPLPENRENENFFILGAIGSGKTVGIINYMLQQLIDDFRAGRRRDKVVLYDVKGDFTQALYGLHGVDVKLFAPWDVRSVRWNLSRDVRSVTDAGLIASAAVPPSHGNRDPYWSNAARSVFEKLLATLWSDCGPNSLQWPTLVAYLSDPIALRVFLETFPEGKQAASNIQGDNAQTQGVLSNLYEHTPWVAQLARAWGYGVDFSLRDWLNDGKPGILIMRNDARYPHIAGPIITMAYQLLMLEHMGRGESWRKDGHGKIWYMLDEFPTLPKINNLIKAIPTIRSLGGCFVLAAQDISQVRAIYGEQDAQTVAGQCATRIYFRLDGDAAEFASDMCGNKEEAMIQAGHFMPKGENLRSLVGTTMQDDITTSPVLLPGEFQALRRADQMNMATEAFFQTSGMPLTKLTWPLTLFPKIAALEERAAWVTQPWTVTQQQKQQQEAEAAYAAAQ